jgi:beta-glucosidase
VQWFADYAGTMVRALGDRVSIWTTINEPWVIVDQGYVHGTLAPGRCDWTEAAAVSRNLILAHGAGVAAVHSEGNHRVGIAVNLTPVHPATESEADRQAAQRMDAYVNRQFLDPLLRGEFPEEVISLYGPGWPVREAVELARVRAPIDFVGVNYYLRLVVRDNPSAGPLGASAVLPPNCRTTAMGWVIYPEGLREILSWVRNRYGNPPVYITENGAAFDEVAQPNGAVDDPQRVQYLREHLQAARQAVVEGVDLRGYFVWSLLDNFEWQHGFSKRFGIVHVDFETQQRLPKTSARFYSRVIRSNGAALED